MTALTLRDVEAADRLALARRDDDGAPAAVTSVVSPGSARTPVSWRVPPPVHPPPSRRAAIAASQLCSRTQAAWRGRRRMVATLPQRTYRAAWSYRGAGRPSGCAGAVGGRPSRRMGRHRTQAHADNGHFVTVVRLVHTISRHTVSVATAGGREPIALLVVPPVPARKLPGAPWTQQPPAHATPRPPTSLLPKTFRNAGEYGAKPGDGATREGNSAADA